MSRISTLLLSFVSVRPSLIVMLSALASFSNRISIGVSDEAADRQSEAISLPRYDDDDSELLILRD